MKEKFKLFKSKEFRVYLACIITAVFAASSFFTELKNYCVELIIKTTHVPNILAETILFLFLIVFIVIAYVYGKRKENEQREIILKIAIDDDSRGHRISEFQSLREGAEADILIMGIGMAYVSTDTDSIVDLLNKNKNIKLLIMNPEMLIKGYADKTIAAAFHKTKIVFNNNIFSDFHAKNDYKKSIEQSIDNIKKIISDRKKLRATNIANNNTSAMGSIELRAYSFYVPMNVTISDIHKPTSRLIIEFCLPFTNKRFRSTLTSGNAKSLIEDQITALWDTATTIDKDQG